jgi:Transposase DDE domain
MPRTRYQPPERLLGATDYSKHDELRGSLNTVKLVKKEYWESDALSAACNLEVNHGRKREAGQWELAAVAFVASRQVDLQPWWDESTDELWRECGFTAKPPYNRVWERLRELGEERSEAFLDAAALVIQRCRAHDPRVMAHVHVDFTEDETHAALVHDCQPGESCKRDADAGSDAPSGPPRGSALRPQRAPTVQAREQREEWNEEDPELSEESAKKAEPDETVEINRGGRTVKRVRSGGCWYLTRDHKAGARAYISNGKVKRYWHGYYSGKMVCAFTSGVIPSVDPANKQEYDLFPALMDRTCAMAGKAPQTVIGDRGFAVGKCFEYATRKGIAPVFPMRKYGNQSQRPDTLTHDRHGVMRCKHCGGEMKQKRFAIEKGKKKETPYLWFKCMAPMTPACAGEQRIRCETDWRSLTPLSRLEPLYHELMASHRQYEGVHDYWRDRYRVAADTLANRPKVVSLNWHRLRANVACLIDWLRIAKLNEWLRSTPPAKRAKKLRKGVRTKMDSGVKAAAELIKGRSNDSLDLPYGPKAAALGFGEATPPSLRSSGDPPGP